jgi:hypothetical protein
MGVQGVTWDERGTERAVNFSGYLGTLMSWNPLRHSRPVTGLLYFYVTCLGQTKGVFTVLEGKSEGKRPLGKPNSK